MTNLLPLRLKLLICQRILFNTLTECRPTALQMSEAQAQMELVMLAVFLCSS